MAHQTIRVELYTLSTCPWSRNAKAWLHDKHVAFEYVDYDLADRGMQTQIQEEMLACGASAFPFVKFGDAELHRRLQPRRVRAPARAAEGWGSGGR